MPVKVKGRRWPEGSGVGLCACACASCDCALTFPLPLGQAPGHGDASEGESDRGARECLSSPGVLLTQAVLLSPATAWSGWWSDDRTSWVRKLKR